MPRQYKRKTERGSPGDVLQQAADKAIKKEKYTIRRAASEYGVNRMTLARYIKAKEVNNDASFGYARCKTSNMVFTPKMDMDLSNHVKKLFRMFHGLSKEKVLVLAYKFAVANGVEVPDSWHRQTKAGQTFWLNFSQRNNLSIRKPESTSLARVTAFNRHTVAMFF